MKKIRSTFNYIFDHRYQIALIIFVLCVIFKISGSSIGLWSDQMNLDNKDTGIIFGKSSPIRSDEWAVLSPMFKAQTESGFNYFNNNLRATKTDVFMIYALPVLNIFQIYRPFLLGFIFLGFERGLSVFWCGRFIALFLVSLELCLLITRKNKLVSLIGATMITLSPIMQWWFAVNGLAEILIFGQLAIVLLYKYLNTENFKKRILYLFLVLICAGGYVLVIYPSWQVPMVYVFLALAIWVIIENRSNSKITKKDILSIIITLAIFGGSMLLILKTSSDTIKTVSNTVYPGARFEMGGGQLRKLFTYLSNFFFPFKQMGLGNSNVCEEALVFSLFPIGLILVIRNMIINKKKDILSICLLIAYMFLVIYCVFGFPKVLSKITLLSNSQPSRAILAVGFIDLLFLIKGLSSHNRPIKLFISILMTIFISAILVILNYKYLHDYYSFKPMIIVLIIIILYLIFFALNFDKKYSKLLFTLGILFTMFISGFLVNPVRTGVSVIEDSKILKEVKKIDKEDSGIWISEGFNFPVNNYIAMAGVKTINVTNTYPDLKKWHKIDPDKKYEDVYNRYAHITMNYVIEEPNEKFILVQPDLFIVNVTAEDLKKLNVKYVFTKNNLDENSIFSKVDVIDEYKIYRRDYLDEE